MAEDRTPQTSDKYIVRFPEGMRDQIADAAKANNRSMNAEIVARLQASLQGSSSGRAGETWLRAGQAEEIARRAGEVAALEVLRFQAQSLQPVHFGGGSVVQGPAPVVEPAIKKHGTRVTIKDRTTKKKSAE